MNTSLQAAALVALLGGTAAAQATEYGTVASSTPVTASVPVSRQVCSDGQQVVQAAPSGAGAVIGAIAGGVIGHQFGNGFGRAAATGIGAIAGSAIGNQVEANANPPTEVPVRRCQNVTSYENRVVGYDVMYDYAGQRYSTRTARDPGTQIAVNVQPLEQSAAGQPVPAYGGEAATSPTPPQTVYYEPVPRTVYYAPAPAVYFAPPVIGFGIGYYGGWRRHW